MKIYADLHLHSRFSRATSKEMNLETLALWARKKGINLLGTGDFTHPVWFSEISATLKEKNEGIYKLEKEPFPSFVLSAELSAIYSDRGKIRRIHIIVIAPNLKSAHILNQKLSTLGNLYADGRPIFGLPIEKLCEIIFETDEDFIVTPAHIWTPWFSLYGSNSGYDSFSECFGKFSDSIPAVETGLSSDPTMNWRIPELDSKAIVSFSDAHSPLNLGRELTVFDLPEDFDFKTFKKGFERKEDKILFTIEFFPEEGKYHLDGHRNCQISLTPKETKAHKSLCPKCKKPLTVGVLHRVDDLAKREEYTLESESHLKKIAGRPGFIFAVPLLEIIADIHHQLKTSSYVRKLYEEALSKATEIDILLNLSEQELGKLFSKELTEAILAMRRGEVERIAGYDGQYGVIKIKKVQKREAVQESLF